MSSITTGTLPGPAGAIEYLLNEPSPAPARSGRGHGLAGVVAHPHPQFGGTMHSRTVFHVARALAALGMPVLRFNFRGVGKSHGAYDQGRGEGDDLRAALAWMAERYARPLVLAGFSFGSVVALRHLAENADERVASFLAVGFPAKNEAPPEAWAWQGPKLLISGTEDVFATPAQLEAAARRLPPPCQWHFIAGADHYLTGRYDECRALIHAHLALP